MHSNPGQYLVSVGNESDFEGIIIKPKVCDFLSQCFDVTQVSEEQVGLTRISSFNFQSMENSKVFKLVFDITFYKQNFNTGITRNMNLLFKLVNFGNPCFKNEYCSGRGTCVADNKYPLDKLTCDCSNTGYKGAFCNETDYCLQRWDFVIGSTPYPNKESEYYCFHKIHVTPRRPKTCANVIGAKKFSCICEHPYQIWNGEGDDQSKWGSVIFVLVILVLKLCECVKVNDLFI